MGHNKMIAEFMGAIVVNEDHNIRFEKPCIENNFEPVNFIGYGSLSYDTSWDWLIPVINKIYLSNKYQEYLDSKNTMFWSGIEINTTFIRVTYEEVVEYIKWYNDNDLNENQILGQSTII